MNNAVTKTAAYLTCLATLLAALTGCASDWRKDMNELKQQDILNETWPELQLVAHTETTEEGWKPSPASITHCYTLTTTPEQAFTAVLNTATNQGWTEHVAARMPDSRAAESPTNQAKEEPSTSSSQPQELGVTPTPKPTSASP